MSIQVKSFLKTDISCYDFSGNLYYVEFESLEKTSLCMAEIDGEFFVLSDGNVPRGTYDSLIQWYVDGEMDLFAVRCAISTGWIKEVGINKKIIDRIARQLK